METIKNVVEKGKEALGMESNTGAGGGTGTGTTMADMSGGTHVAAAGEGGHFHDQQHHGQGVAGERMVGGAGHGGVSGTGVGSGMGTHGGMGTGGMDACAATTGGGGSGPTSDVGGVSGGGLGSGVGDLGTPGVGSGGYAGEQRTM